MKIWSSTRDLVLIAHGKCIFNHPYWCSRDSVLKFGRCLHLHTLWTRAAKVLLCLTSHFHRLACSFIAQYWVMNQNQMCMLIWFSICLLFIINLVCFETCKDELDVMFVWMVMFSSFDMQNIKMILYKQNVTLRLSLMTEIMQTKLPIIYWSPFILQWLQYNTYNAREFF